MRRLRAALVLAAWLPCAPAAGATAAVLPLLSQELTIITVQAVKASRLDHNAYDTPPLKEAVFEVVDAVKPAAGAVNADLLLLVVPHRAQPWLTEERGHRGSGNASGLGLYINRIDRMRRADTGESAVGYLGL